MEQLKSMKQCLIACAQAQMNNLQNVDAKELGEVIDMIKDLEEACYYATITKAMTEENKKEEVDIYRDWDRPMDVCTIQKKLIMMKKQDIAIQREKNT